MTNDTIEFLWAENRRLREALERAERKLTAYVGVCAGDKELTDAVLPMARAALAAAPDDGRADEWAGWTNEPPSKFYYFPATTEMASWVFQSSDGRWVWMTSRGRLHENGDADTAAEARAEVLKRVKPAETADKFWLKQSDPPDVGNFGTSDRFTLYGIFCEIDSGTIVKVVHVGFGTCDVELADGRTVLVDHSCLRRAASTDAGEGAR